MGEPRLDGGGCRVTRTAFPSEGVFISYRREDTGPYARLLKVKLSERFPHAAVFMDLDPIEAGVDFAEVIESAVASKTARRTRVSPQKLTGLAAFIAGPKRDVIAGEWRSHLLGETGTGLSEDRQTRDAVGFILAAVRYRLQDAADLAWRPVDTVLASRTVSNLVVLLVTLATAAIFTRQGGLYGLADNLVSVGVVWGAAFGLIHYGRQWRDVKPPERKPRRAKQ